MTVADRSVHCPRGRARSDSAQRQPPPRRCCNNDLLHLGVQATSRKARTRRSHLAKEDSDESHHRRSRQRRAAHGPSAPDLRSRGHADRQTHRSRRGPATPRLTKSCGGSVTHANSRRSSDRAAEADVVAAITGDDEDNLVISLLAKRESVCHVSGPRQRPEQRVDVQRHVGCRPFGVDATPADRPRRRGRHGRVVRTAAEPRTRPGPKSRQGHAGRRLTGHCQGADRPSACPRVDNRRGPPRWSRRRARAATPCCTRETRCWCWSRAASRTTFVGRWSADRHHHHRKPRTANRPMPAPLHQAHADSPTHDPPARLRGRQGHTHDGTADGRQATLAVSISDDTGTVTAVLDRTAGDRRYHPRSPDCNRRCSCHARRPPQVHQPWLHAAAALTGDLTTMPHHT